jgi:hypothetical protein
MARTIVSHKKPPPLRVEAPFRKRCPVCKEVSYSHTGIHPQCAQQRSGAVRLRRVEALVAAIPATNGQPADVAVRRWEKRCPACGTTLHVRKRACSCGHVSR